MGMERGGERGSPAVGSGRARPFSGLTRYLLHLGRTAQWVHKQLSKFEIEEKAACDGVSRLLRARAFRSIARRPGRLDVTVANGQGKVREY